MFKTLLRTLSALSIITITASAGFAQDKTPASVTTDVWKEGFGSPDKQPSISPKEIDDIVNNQFLAPNANWADNADGPAHDEIDLNFDTTDDNVVNPTTLGTAVFYRGHNSSPNTYNHHAGILGNADLGAPLTETLGWVEWSGTIKAVGLYDIDKAFTLRVTFPGTIAGIVRQRGDYHYKIDGNFNSKGVIIGTVEYALFDTNAQGELALTPEGEFISIAAGRVKGKLSGLIGENGALGVFHSVGGRSSGYAGYAGGFSATWDSRAHKSSLARCTADPFADNCESDGFKEHRELRLDYCITGGNAETDPIKCHNATIFSSCVIDPFHSTCNEDNFPDLIKARLNRAEFCNNSANDANVRRTLCTETHIVTGICTDDPFNAICGTDYGPARISRCRTSQTANDCTATIVKVCSDNPFDMFCGDVYDDARLEACRNGKQEGNSCASAHVSMICGDNPFNALCEASSYDDARLEFCRDGRQKKDSDCSAGLVSMICGDNPFNTLCEAEVDYDGARLEACRAGEQNDDKDCVKHVSSICGTNPFNRLCEADYGDERLDACRSGTQGVGDCTDHVSSICGTNPFNTLCEADYGDKRLDACRSGTQGAGDCTVHVSSICGANPFNTLCEADYGDERVNLIKRCVGTSGDTTCTGAISTITDCETNPFSDTQFCRLGVFQTARVTFCQRGGNASHGNCTEIVGRDSCIENPFADGCTGDKHKTGRTHRVTFCAADTTNHALCTQYRDCKADPFGAKCAWDNFENRRVTLIDRCYADANGEGCTVITPVINDCKTNNAFGANCYFEVFNAKRQELLTACKNNTSACTDSIEASMRTQPNAVAWEHVVTTRAENRLVLGDGAGVISLRDQFVKNIEDAQTNSRIQIFGGAYKSSNLEVAKFSINGTRVSLGGDPEDGVAYFAGRSTGQSGTYYYAGIFSTTDLGAPVTDEQGTASWVGSFTSGYYGNNYSSPQDFVLEVNFDDKSIGAFVSSSYLIKGNYDDNGVIGGKVIRGSFTPNDRKPSPYNSREFSLTGLIGKEGAVGVFLGGRYRGGFVARPADDVPGAVVFLDRTCTRDPFHKFCYLSKHQKIRIEKCITGNKAGTPLCTSAIEYKPCILRPFDAQCKTTFGGYNETQDKPYYQIARDERSAFCSNSANVDDGAFNTLCTDAEVAVLCPHDPFRALCSNTNYNNVRKVICRSELDSERCANHQPSGNVTTASWLHSFYEGNGVVRQTVTGEGIDTLNLNTATFDGQSLGGNAANGVAFLSYNGILSGTDLGAPFVETTIGMKFYGQFQYGQPQFGLSKTDFTLDITFNAESTDGTVNALVHENGLYYYSLTGDFDSNGVISGTVDLGFFWNHDQITSEIFYNSVLTGLIGTEGAVGVFTGDRSGGFVAVPKEDVTFDSNVRFSDWVRSFDTPPYPSVRRDETQQTRFLQGKETDLGKRYLKATLPGSVTFANGDFGEEGAGGVAYMSGTHRRDANPHHVAGILSGTHLGAPLDAPVTASWDGKLGMIVDAVEVAHRDITLNINFARKGIEIAYVRAPSTHFVRFNGLSFDEAGVITGEMTYYNYWGVSNPATNSVGKVKGLIGQQGAVGAFISNPDNPSSKPSYAGGFVAAPTQ